MSRGRAPPLLTPPQLALSIVFFNAAVVLQIINVLNTHLGSQSLWKTVFRFHREVNFGFWRGRGDAAEEWKRLGAKTMGLSTLLFASGAVFLLKSLIFAYHHGGKL